MKAHIDAIKALIPSAYKVYFVDVPEAPVYPYVLLWTSAGSPGVEVNLCGANADIDAVVGVTHVATSPDGVLAATSKTRAALQPNGRIKSLAVAGRAAWLKHYDAQTVQVDRDATLPGSNSHTAFAVDLYRLTSTPI